jgi:hypothetical protein
VKPPGKELKIATVPPKATCLVQPLDRFFFRMWKEFVRRITDYVELNELDVNIHRRDEIIKLQSLTHHQFSADRFKPFIKYSWHCSGYLDEKPEEFEHPVQFCFGNLADECEECNEMPLMKCSHCQKSLCFHHFYELYHYCNFGQMESDEEMII